jgi:anti-sigma regulatory factor (Ser/Thr protein kinase)
MEKNRLAFRIQLKTAFSVKSVRTSRKIIGLVAREWGFTEQDTREIELCYSEAVQNAMEHGSNNKAHAAVQCDVSETMMKITIEDEGAGEGDIEELKAAFDDGGNPMPHQDEERGRGIYIIRSFMDESTLDCMEGGGVRLTMIKKKN